MPSSMSFLTIVMWALGASKRGVAPVFDLAKGSVLKETNHTFINENHLLYLY